MTHGEDATAVVRRLFTAHAEGRIDDVLACVHPEILWEVEGVPARDFYVGREGTLALLADMREALGDHWTRVDSLLAQADGQVLMTATLLSRTPDGDVPARTYAALFTLRDGLVYRFHDVSDETPSGSDLEHGENGRRSH